MCLNVTEENEVAVKESLSNFGPYVSQFFEMLMMGFACVHVFLLDSE